MDRRRLLTWLANAGGGLIAAIVGIPALISACAPLLGRRRGPVWQPVGALKDFAVDQVVEARVAVPREDWSPRLREKGVFVWRPDADQVVVFSRNCTDLSCPVNWDSGSQCFFCPCHGGIFAKDGARMAGPPDRPLFRYATRVRDGVLEIDLRSLPLMT